MAFVSPTSLKNLLLSGESLRAIARQTGLDHRRLSEYARGQKSTPKAVRDTLNAQWRTNAYDRLRRENFSPRQARQGRDMSYSRLQEQISTQRRNIDTITKAARYKDGSPVSRETIAERFAKSKKNLGDYVEYEERV